VSVFSSTGSAGRRMDKGLLIWLLLLSVVVKSNGIKIAGIKRYFDF